MTAPTQQLPPWLSISTSIATDANGNPTATATTLLQLPLTYYGPPIPLGTDGVWVYGGLSSPPPTASATSAPISSSATPSSPSSIPSSISATPSSSLTPSPSSSLTLTSSASTSSASSAAAPTSSAPVSSAGSSSPKRTVIGAVLGAVLGSLLFLLLLILFLRWRARRGRGTGALGLSPTRTSHDNPLWMWEMVDEDGQPRARPPGEGSPRGSGEEADPFLRPSGAAAPDMKEAEPTARLVTAPRTSTDTSGPIGIALAGGISEKAGEPAPIAQSGDTRNGGGAPTPSPAARHIIPRDVLARMYADAPKSPEAVDEHEPGVDSPLLPPRPLDPGTTGGRSHQSSTSLVSRGSRKPSNASLGSEGSGNDPDVATVQTARRVRLRSSGGLSTVADESPTDDAAGASWARAVGISSLKKLGRLSWFRNAEGSNAASSRPNSSRVGSRSRPTSIASRGMSDADVEAARRLEIGYRDGSRPLSAVSGRSAASGNTVFYDAASSASSGVPPVPPLPSGTASSGRGPSVASPLSVSHRPEPERSNSDPPAYEAHTLPPSQALSPTSPRVVDFLDIPVPRPVSPFTIASSSTSRTGVPRPTVPPGLTLLNTQAWRDSGSAGTPLSAGSSTGFSVDALEEAPPAAGEGWRTLSRAIGPEHEKRTTFGLPRVVSPRQDHTPSREASLHSHLSPRTVFSMSGSAPASSHSSRPSGHTQERTGSSGLSGVRTGSVSSDGRRRPSRHSPPGEISPPLSAVGHPSSMVPGVEHRPFTAAYTPQSSPHTSMLPVGPVPISTVTSTGTTGTGETSSSVTTHTSITDPVTGEVMRFPHVPWTAGVDQDSDDAASGGWGGSWSSPNHLRALQNRVADRHSGSYT
ncbi:hypothetical protein FA95DRAFT_1562431 [Auriscalpium vulgare]|uniref:Uncharacterized protein n=1 Tax=Auriscalpium vulgare TaxID=40419 RepID=A0ACB8RJK3_9AGAM|nr:hypothetical protein FA95DRAFT_1562431 [Auriscalpium vulgare]